MALCADKFEINGVMKEAMPYGNGHINDTYMAVFADQGREERFILQRMNRYVFKDPAKLMENVLHVTDYLQKKIREQGGDPRRETLNIIPARDGKPYYMDENGEYWRAYRYIEGSYEIELAECSEDLYQCALAFGKFQKLLADYPAETLYEIIPQFHDTANRIQNLKKAVKEDVSGRAAQVSQEIAFALDREEDMCELIRLQKAGELPVRVTHNDTKINNVLIDKKTGRGLCVVDLDTVMPGLAAYDFGDSIRTGAATAAEDETDLSRVSCSLELFEAYSRGFVEGCGGKLTLREIETLPLGAKIMTYENGVRFLTDYLEGDVYFKIARKGHNLDRCRCQFQLVSDMETKWDALNSIVGKYK